MKPNNRLIASLAFAAVCLIAVAVRPAASAEMNANGAEVITNGPQTSPGDAQGARSGQQNLRGSERYESQVHSDPNFRADRERKECGPITDPRMHADCVAGLRK
jgi:hypothetical protein